MAVLHPLSLWMVSLTLWLLVSGCEALSTNTPTTITTIQVCQDKHCCQRFTGRSSDLVQTLRQLAPLSGCTIESTTCLSHCDKGPNVKIRMMTASQVYETVEHDVANAPAAAAMLELLFENNQEEERGNYQIHPTLLAAASVMERAHKATTIQEKERFLNSVMKALEKEDELAKSKSMAQALVMRARLQGDSAKMDATRASQLDPWHPTVWRVLADASPDDPTYALNQWIQYQPHYRTKAKKELQLWQESQEAL
mmetsp:Transcript_10585/g.17516  ORF Transcript_10585/g.17516 Transcript_10585/m.17516 type:complete len:254 (-) Transcript_10585:172-933(-)|eukprot:CAMPEP_0119009726 /NCGR_PEP_ID=MMETSP1176-20130426/4562_1 /TAXON_ID=265551 /ORGANISM="Synedropsis recta cf, Strain CCMP1620" /LENGTH=253 /DNA_ID=CAMNT_0006962295 /DNA_START=107 /DNA_END=868 /DNA_ORIENTATION=-